MINVRSLLLLLFVRILKSPFSVQSQFQVAIPTTKALALALLSLSARGSNPTSLKFSSHSEP
jgi:hypothetical protein